MGVFQLIVEMTEQMDECVDNSMVKVHASKLGLDERCGMLYIDPEEGIAVDSRNDRTLQYYGEFEYIDECYRVELGNYVFYFSDAERVQNCLDEYKQNMSGQNE